MIRATRVAALVLVLFACAATGVQAEKPKGSAPKLQEYDEIERGFWLRSTFGLAVSISDMFGQDGREASLWPPGALIGLEAGLDFGQFASIHLALYGQQIIGSRDTGAGRADVANDAGTLLVMAGGRFNLTTSKRLGWFLKVNVGYLLGAPEVAGLDDSLVFHAGTGVEYATNLRHFFIGLEAMASYLLSSNGISVLLTPTVKYTF